MSTTIKLSKNENGKSIDEKMYRGNIGFLLYLTTSRPDKMFVIYLYTRFQSSPKESYFHTIKRIFKYLIGTMHLGLWYPKSSIFDLISYSDDFIGSLFGRKSTFKTCQFLRQCLLSLFIKK